MRILVSIIVLFSLNISCKEHIKNTVLTKEITFTKEGEAILKKAKNDSILTHLDIEIADDDYQTQTGLMYRHSIKPNQGMLFVFEQERPHSFYMKNTEIPLDIIFFNSDKKVVNIQKNAIPFDETSLPSKKPAQFVLEVHAGLSDSWKLEEGDILEFFKN